MKRSYLKSALWLACLAGLAGSIPELLAQTGKDKPRTVELTLEPAPEPNPAFAYRLHVTVPNREPGNAAQSYYRAITLLPNQPTDTNWDHFVELLTTNVAILRSKNSEPLPKSALRELHTAAHRQYCHWEFPMKEGFSLLLPELARFKKLGQAVALQARFQIANRQWEDALESLTAGFALGHDTGLGSPLINGLVGIAIGQIMLNQVEEFVQQPGAPNLYWALTALPSPLVDLRLSMEWENQWLFHQFPELREIEKKVMSAKEASRLLRKLPALMDGKELSEEADSDWRGNAAATAFVGVFYPLAKKTLLQQGFAEKTLDAFPAAQVTLIHGLRVFQHYSQNSLKWAYVPYRQATGANRSAELEKLAATNDLNEKLMGAPVMMLLPALSRAHMRSALLERNFAMLRCVEAIRMHASQNQGKLPGSLPEIQAVPVPENPITGSPFLYKVEGGKAILEAGSPPGEAARTGLKYVLTINATTTK